MRETVCELCGYDDQLVYCSECMLDICSDCAVLGMCPTCAQEVDTELQQATSDWESE